MLPEISSIFDLYKIEEKIREALNEVLLDEKESFSRTAMNIDISMPALKRFLTSQGKPNIKSLSRIYNYCKAYNERL